MYSNPCVINRTPWTSFPERRERGIREEGERQRQKERERESNYY